MNITAFARAVMILLLLLVACTRDPNPDRPVEVPTLAVLPSITPLPPSATPTPPPTLTPTPRDTATPTPTRTPTYTPTPVYAPLGTLRGALGLDTAQDAALISDFERHVYLIAGAAGRYLTVSAAAIGDGDPAITLYDPAGNALATDDDSGGGSNALLRDIPLTSDGDYILQVRGTGSYRLMAVRDLLPQGDAFITAATATPSAAGNFPGGTLTPIPLNDRETVLTDHQPVIVNIEADGFARLFFDVDPNTRVSLAAWAAEGSRAQPRLELLNPTGEVIAVRDPDNGRAELLDAPLVVEGRYTLFITDAGDTGGRVVVAYGQGSTYNENLRGAAPPDTVLQGSPTSGVRDVWTLTLRAGDVFALNTNADAQPQIDLVAPNGEIVQGDTAPVDGDYTLRVSGGAYALAWTLLDPAPQPVLILSADDTVPPRSYLYYPFQGRAGDVLTATVTGLAGVDPVAALLTVDGVLIAEDDDSGGDLNPLIETTLPVDGTFTLRVSAYGDQGGQVRVEVYRVE